MGELVNIRGAYTGRSWQYNEDEDVALDYLPHIDQVLYLRGLRKYMDFANGVVGIRRKVSYQMFRELLEIHRRRGSTKPEYYPKRDEVRASLSRLEVAGLIVRMPSATKAIADSMVFKLPLANFDLGVLPNEEQQGHSTGATTRENSVVAGAGNVMNPTNEKAMNNTPPYIRITDIKEYTNNSGELSDSVSNQSLISQKPKAVNHEAGGVKICPHQEILQIWSEIFPGKTQPNVNLWGRQKASGHLRSIWRETSTIMHSSGTRTLYSNREEGLIWWRAFLTDLSKSNFLMSSEANFFDLAWLVKRENFLKSLSGKYRNKGNGHA